MLTSKFPILFTMIILGSLIISCTPTKEGSYQLGDAQLKVTGSTEAIAQFDKGLLLLHSFEYWDAADAFIKAQELDSTMVMAYWGEAMTHNHPLWRQQDYDKGTEALNKLASDKTSRAQLVQTQLEGDLLNAIEILYGEGTKFERDKAYSDYLGRLHEKYPENHEISAFYAVSLLGAVEEGRDDEMYEKSAVVAQGILEENPNHPGALHYLIHSYDDPKNAYKALSAANSYSKVAKDAGHALHMPSHIYVALGMWNEVVSSNEASFEASAARAKRKNLKSGGSYHALHWLMYGYLQQGRWEEAEELLNDMVTYNNKFTNTRSRDYLISMKANYLVETNDWSNPIAEIEVENSDLLVSSRTTQAFITGMLAYEQKDIQQLEKVIDGIDRDRAKAHGKIATRNVSMCSGNWQYEFPNQLDIDKSHVMQLELSALLAWSQQDKSQALEYAEQASDLEERISYSYGPPAIPKPSNELYAELLLASNNPTEALKQFDKSLKRAPKRVLSLKGKLDTYKKMNQQDSVQSIQKQLDAINMSKEPQLVSASL